MFPFHSLNTKATYNVLIVYNKLLEKPICCFVAAGFLPRKYLIRYPPEPIVFRSLSTPSPLQVQFRLSCLCFLHFLKNHLATQSCLMSFFAYIISVFLFSCIMPSFSESSCCPECDPLLKWGLNEGGAQII